MHEEHCQWRRVVHRTSHVNIAAVYATDTTPRIVFGVVKLQEEGPIDADRTVRSWPLRICDHMHRNVRQPKFFGKPRRKGLLSLGFLFFCVPQQG